MVEVRGTQSFLDAIGLLLASGREELLIGFGNFSLRPSWLLVINECRLATEREVWRDHNGLHWSGELTAALYAQAKETERGLLLVHAHGGRDEVPRLSKTDQLTAHLIEHGEVARLLRRADYALDEVQFLGAFQDIVRQLLREYVRRLSELSSTDDGKPMERVHQALDAQILKTLARQMT
jgi:hypothetical protein